MMGMTHLLQPDARFPVKTRPAHASSSRDLLWHVGLADDASMVQDECPIRTEEFLNQMATDPIGERQRTSASWGAGGARAGHVRLSRARART
jgi:hypothetical protein